MNRQHDDPISTKRRGIVRRRMVASYMGTGKRAMSDKMDSLHVEARDLAGGYRGDVRYNHFGPTMLALLAYLLPSGQSVVCL